MKKVFCLLTFCCIFISCEKQADFLILRSEIPKWLQDRIIEDEKTIESNPKSGLDIGAWIRYNYKGNVYFEYINLLSSAGPRTYRNGGTEFLFIDNEFQEYQSNKCCKKYIWKGSHYTEIF